MLSVSIVIATFNHAPYLARAIESALAQTVAAEVIVVDDGSTDRTQEVLARYGDRISVLRHDVNTGVARARNAGLHASRGDCIMFLDADDTIEPTKIAAQTAVLAADPAVGWVYCDVRIIPSGSSGDAEPRLALRPTRASLLYGYAARPCLEGDLSEQLASANFIPVHAPLVRREVFEEVGVFDPEAPVEDWDLWTRVARAATARYVPEVLATYWRSATGRNSRRVGARGVHA